MKYSHFKIVQENMKHVLYLDKYIICEFLKHIFIEVAQLKCTLNEKCTKYVTVIS